MQCPSLWTVILQPSSSVRKFQPRHAFNQTIIYIILVGEILVAVASAKL